SRARSTTARRPPWSRRWTTRPCCRPRPAPPRTTRRPPRPSSRRRSRSSAAAEALPGSTAPAGAARLGRPVGGRVAARIGRLVAALVANLVDEHQTLAVCLLQFPDYVADGGQDRGHRESQAGEATAGARAGALPVPDVVQAGVPDRPGFLDVI